MFIDPALRPPPGAVSPFAGMPRADAIALQFAAALMQTGKYDTPEAAIGAAWSAVPEFYMAALRYSQTIGPIFFAAVSDDDEPPSFNTEAQNDYG